MPHPRDYHFILPASKRPGEVRLEEPWYPGVQEFWPSCTTPRSVDPILGIRAVVIHATAGSSSSGAVSVMKKSTDPASFHWLVPDEDEAQHGKLVWACVPEALAAWHVRNEASNKDVAGGAKRVNHWSLGIEVVNAQKNDPFSPWQLQATARIVRHCWSKYPNLVHVVSHAKLDPLRRSDPGTQFDWAQFEDMVFSMGDDPVSELIGQVTPLADLVVADSGSDCCNAGAA